MGVSEFLKEKAEERRAAFYAHVRPWIGIGAAVCKATGRRLTWEEHTGLIELWDGANSYERKLLIPLLDDEGLCRHAEYCMGQAGRELGELELARHYNDAVEREIAPLLVKRLREATQMVEGLSIDADTYRKALGHSGQYGREQYARAQAKWGEVVELRRQLQILQVKVGAEGAELDEARREAAAWEVQCQDLRDKLVQREAGRVELLKMTAKLADYLETANGIIKEDYGDEDDVAEAQELVAAARTLIQANKENP